MRFRSRLAHRRRAWFGHRYGRWAVLALVLAALAPDALSAQTITATIPDSIALGARATVRPEVRDVLGRLVPSPRGRVFLSCDSPTIVSAAVDRLTAHAVGSTICRALWDRYDYARVEVSHLVRVYAPPVVVGSLPCRALVATGIGRIEPDTAVFVRALAGLPTVRYCVDRRLAVVLEGDLVAPGEEPGAGTITTLYFPPGAVLPVVVP